MKLTHVQRQKSGQALIVTSLIIAVLLSSTAYYVLEVNTTVTMDMTQLNQVFFTTKQSIVNTLITALANMSNHGEPVVLSMDLERLSAVIKSSSYGGKYDLSLVPLNSTPYQDGLLISWLTNGSGISSACVDVALNFSTPGETYNSAYKVNVTTTLTIQSSSVTNGTQRSVSVICHVFNENNAASANDITLSYQETNGSWTIVDSSYGLNINDCGNGTYWASFQTNAQGALQVSAQAHDLRNILVIANTTCSED